VIGSLVWVCLGVLSLLFPPEPTDRLFAFFETPVGRLFDGMLTLVLMIPVSAALIGLSGSSPGKWIFGVRVADVSGRPIGLTKAIVREAKVWLRGLGAGIPLVALFALWSSKEDLESKGRTAWDGTDVVVIHRKDDLLQRVLTFAGATIVLGGWIALKVASYLLV
jgi:uncharacterized RDD family membrane protein YckC